MTPYAANPCDLCAELSPDAVIAYLTAKGYTRGLTYETWKGDPAAVTYHPADPQVEPVEVPLNPALRDYGRRMHEALDALDGPFLGLLHAIDPERFPRERILLLAGVTS